VKILMKLSGKNINGNKPSTRPLRSGVGEKHLKGPSMSVCPSRFS
jgi:hypothetical protein